MMIHKWLGIMGLLLVAISFTVAAQTEPIITYTSDNVDWQMSAENDYIGDARNPVIFLNVAADDDGHIYVANFSSVLIFDAETGELQDAILDDTGTVIQYDDVAPAGEGGVWVADSKTFTVYLLDPEGSILQSIAADTTNRPTTDMRPNELEVGPDGNVYVMYSSANTEMQVFTPEGEFVRSFTMGDRTLSSGLIDFAFGPDGNLYIAGAGTIRVLDSEGNIVVENFAQDFLQERLMNVHGVAVDAEGHVYIGGNSTAEDGSLVAAVYKYDAEGQVLAQFGKAQQRMDWGSEFNSEELSFTVSLAVLPEGQLIISDANGGYSQLLMVDLTE
ncbi:MAG: NHL repeat-containing protein [Burkholderiales bacterium]|nr:NHL repeat-containing protein [Anaerolineae bacterium]